MTAPLITLCSPFQSFSRLVWFVIAACSACGTSGPCHAEVIFGPISNPSNGHHYYLLEQSDWTRAQEEATSLGGSLAVINDQAEHEWVFESFANVNDVDRNLWIGLTDSATESNFEWVTGDPVDFTNWFNDEPNNNLGDEDFTHMFAPSVSPTGMWNDLNDVATSPRGIGMFGVAELVPETSGQLMMTVATLLLTLLLRRNDRETADPHTATQVDRSSMQDTNASKWDDLPHSKGCLHIRSEFEKLLTIERPVGTKRYVALRSLLIAFSAITFAPSLVSAQFPSWTEQRSGSYGDGSNWQGGVVPTPLDVPLFGTSTETTASRIDVAFTENQTNFGAWVASGEFNFNFAAANLSYGVNDLKIGGSDAEFFVLSDGSSRVANVDGSLPGSAMLVFRSTGTSPAALTTRGLQVGPAPLANQTIRSGRLQLDGSQFTSERVDDDFVSGRVIAGGLGNTGLIEVLNGSKLTAELDIFLGGGESRPFEGKPEIEVGNGTLFVSGVDPSGSPSSVATNWLNVGSSDFDNSEPLGYSDRRVSVGTVLVENGAELVASRIRLGYDSRDPSPFLTNSRVDLGLPPDTITIVGNSHLIVESELLSGLESILDLEGDSANDRDGGIATVGNVADELLASAETLYLGNHGTLSGLGTIQGDIVQSGGSVRPGFFSVIAESSLPASLTVEGNWLTSSGAIEFDFAGVDNPLHDQLNILGDVSVSNAELTIDFNGFTPQAGQRFELFSVGGQFAADDILLQYENVDPAVIPLIRFSDGHLFVVPEPTHSTWTQVMILFALAIRRRIRMLRD